MVGGFSNPDPAILNFLNAPNAYPNPSPLDYIYATYTSVDFCYRFGNSGLLAQLEALPAFGPYICPLLDTQPKTASIISTIENFLMRCSGINLLTTTKYMNLCAFVSGVVPDPSWNSGISIAQQYLGRSADLDDVRISHGYYNGLVGITEGII